MKIETEAYRSGSYAGLPVWRGRYRILDWKPGFEIGWTLATNAAGRAIAYESKEDALAGALVCGEQFSSEPATSPAPPPTATR